MAKRGGHRLFLGLLLLGIGMALLLARMHLVGTGPAFLLALGAAFSLYGVATGSFPSLVPGCVLLGLGSGMLLGDLGVEPLGVWQWNLVGLGGGLVLLFLLALVLGLGVQWWALVVALVLGGVAFLPRVRELFHPPVVVAMRTYWPVVLMVLGLYLVARDLKR
ncbi:MAG: hypothetical protein NZ869_03590 [Thermoanaerobaculum sp.]|nr:hypothetical protein [Thermoanaerobaculum sp.]MDW7968309.1 hypothetical protein [Thermoanaerobaculum sp.]